MGETKMNSFKFFLKESFNESGIEIAIKLGAFIKEANLMDIEKAKRLVLDKYNDEEISSKIKIDNPKWELYVSGEKGEKPLTDESIYKEFIMEYPEPEIDDFDDISDYELEMDEWKRNKIEFYKEKKKEWEENQKNNYKKDLKLWKKRKNSFIKNIIKTIIKTSKKDNSYDENNLIVQKIIKFNDEFDLKKHGKFKLIDNKSLIADNKNDMRFQLFIPFFKFDALNIKKIFNYLSELKKFDIYTNNTSFFKIYVKIPKYQKNDILWIFSQLLLSFESIEKFLDMKKFILKNDKNDDNNIFYFLNLFMKEEKYEKLRELLEKQDFVKYKTEFDENFKELNHSYTDKIYFWRGPKNFMEEQALQKIKDFIKMLHKIFCEIGYLYKKERILDLNKQTFIDKIEEVKYIDDEDKYVDILRSIRDEAQDTKYRLSDDFLKKYSSFIDKNYKLIPKITLKRLTILNYPFKPDAKNFVKHILKSNI